MPPKRNILKLTELKPHRPQEMKENEDQYEKDLRQLQQWRETNGRLQLMQSLVQSGIYTGEIIANMLITQQNYAVGMRGMNMIMHVADEFIRRELGLVRSSPQASHQPNSNPISNRDAILISDDLFDQEMPIRLLREVRRQLNIVSLALRMSGRRERLMESNPELFYQTMKQFNEMYDRSYVDMLLNQNYDTYHNNFMTQFHQSGRQFHVEIRQNEIQVFMTGDLYPFQEVASSSQNCSVCNQSSISSSFDEDKDTQYESESESEKWSNSFQKKENIDDQNKIDSSKEEKKKMQSIKKKSEPEKKLEAKDNRQI